jgi:hypothetical protein
VARDALPDRKQAGSLFYPFDALSLAQGRTLVFGASSNVPRSAQRVALFTQRYVPSCTFSARRSH